MHDVDIAILGSGPCGLGAAWRIERLQAEGHALTYAVIDRQPAAGGSASSVTTAEGFTFDFGGHILYPHEHYSDFRALLDDVVPAWHESVPIRGVWIDGRLVPYPVQRNIHRLSPAKVVRSLAGVARVRLRKLVRKSGPHPAESKRSLHHYLIAEFGTGLTELVMGPLNRKMWAHPLTELSCAWTYQRSGSAMPNVALVNVRQILRSIVTRKDNPGWTPETRVRYPASGGSGAIWKNLAARLSPDAFQHGKRVLAIDAVQHVITFDDGSRLRYRRLLSTIPLDSLQSLLQPRSEGFAQRLRFSRAVFAGFGLAGPMPEQLAGVHGFHIPDATMPCWRITLPAALSPGNVPSAKHWSLLCEASFPETSSPDAEDVARQIESKLRQFGFIGPANTVVSRWSSTMRHGYPLPFLDRDSILQTLDAELKRADILSRGRFGGWKYEVSNQDHSFMQGVEAVDYFVSGRPEETYRFPAAVNA